MPFRPYRRSVQAVVSKLVLALSIVGMLAVVPGCAAKHNAPGGGGGGGIPKELDSGNIAASGGTFAHTFTTAGAYGYHCSIHSSMVGTVTVDASQSGMTADVTITGIAPFAAASVKPGGTVTWHNNSTMAHTVTSN